MMAFLHQCDEINFGMDICQKTVEVVSLECYNRSEVLINALPELAGMKLMKLLSNLSNAHLISLFEYMVLQ